MPHVITSEPQRTPTHDLGHLAWVLEDVRKSLHYATNAVRRFEWDITKGVNFSARDYSDMQMAFRQAYQSAGALDMVGHQHPAKLVRAMGDWIQGVLHQPDTFVPDATAVFERASRALLDYFEGLLKGSSASTVALFVQYRAILQLAGTERIHPAQLWPGIGSWENVELAAPLQVLQLGGVSRRQLDEALLPILKNFDAVHGRRMVDLCIGLACSSTALSAQTFWSIAAAFFEAISLAELPNDVYVRRTAARIIPAHGLLAEGKTAALEGLAHELLFYCAFAKLTNVDPKDAPMLNRVRKVFGIEHAAPLDYESSPFGKYDPLALAQLRQHIGVAAEAWSALSGGDLGRASAAVAQFAEMSAAVLRLHPECAALVSALTTTVETTARRAKVPSPAIAMEVATAILYLEIAYDDLDLANHTMEQRSARLAARLRHVLAGGDPMPIEQWMESLYRRVGDRKTMGTVVEELALSLAEIEKSLDAYVRNPAEVIHLEPVPVALGHMRGVFSVLGMDQAALAALRMRASVEHLMALAGADVEKSKKWTLQLVNSLSAMGFLIDMLRYQPTMAKELFEYDEGLCEFRLTMEREQGHAQADRVSKVHAFSAEDAAPTVVSPDADPAANTVPLIAMPAIPPVVMHEGATQHDEGADLEIQDIFLSEACAVINEGKASIIALSLASSNLDALVSLRRAFHTLKGSARMVGFEDFGEGAWAFEQLLNAWLDRKRLVSETLLALCEDALDAMVAWIESASSQPPPEFPAVDFRLCADALRLEDRYLAQRLSRRHGLENTDLQPNSREAAVSNPPASPETTVQADENGRQAEKDVLTASANTSLYQGAVGAPSPSAPFITIGRLHLRLDFFEVFVNEAGLWAGQLQSAIHEDWYAPNLKDVLQRLAGLAHALQGSAAAVGFTGLATLAQSMERAIEYFIVHASFVTDDKVVLGDASQEIGRLVEAFANGVLAKPSASVLESLERLVDTHVAPSDVKQPVEFASSEGSAQGVGTEALARSAAEHAAEVTAAPAAVSISLRHPDGFDNQDALDADLWPVFFEEGVELLQGLAHHVQLAFALPQEMQWRAQILRILHTLKGSARLAGALRLGELAHRMESAMEEVDGHAPLQSADNAYLQQYLDQLETLFADLASKANADSLVNLSKPSPEPMPSPGPVSAGLAPPAAAPPPRTLASTSLRVRSQVLDRLIDQAGEVMIGRTRMDQRLGQLHNSVTELGRNLDRLRLQLRDLEIQTELQMRSRQTHSPEPAALFDPLELDRFTALQEVSRMMAESIADAEVLHKGLQSEVDGAQEDLLGQGRRAKELTNGLLRMRLVEFESISDRLYGVVRQAAKETGKLVRLDIVGGSIEMDRGVLDRMTPAFEHMLRNAVVHGIEPSETRVAAGKPATGAITISVHQDGSDVSVRFVDDGAGLQLEKIRARAIEAQLLETDTPLSYDQAAKLLFIPGFSTADKVTELAGRGIGMDVVLSDISAIGGRIETSSQTDGGTSFQVVFPLTTAVTQIVMLRIDTFTIGVPANLLETVLRIPPDRVDAAYAESVLQHGSEQSVPFFWAGAILGVFARGHGGKMGARHQSVAVIRSAGQRVALHVDEVLGSREVVVKNLGAQLSQVPGLVGISVLASGAVVLIYNPVALMNVYGEAIRSAHTTGMSARAPLSPSTNALSDSDAPTTRTAPLVLVVDDSITVRRVTQRLLSRAGFRVALASDGIQALELLRDDRPAMVLSDIEMPRMDGLELTRQIRADAQLSDLPVIIITSRTAQKHRDQAAALGANHYLGKPYAEAELLDLVRLHCAVAETAEVLPY